MCGIIGAVGEFPELTSTQFNKARDLMWHRGPDDSGFCQVGKAILGFRRLAILDLSTAGHQPMMSPDERVAVVFNGEIYNFQSLRSQLQKTHSFRSHTDTEVILNGYLEWGWDELLQRLEGMFAIAIWDNRTRTLYAARDRVGKKPFFYYQTARGLYFASTLNALKEMISGNLRVNPLAIDAYLTYQAVPAPLSIYQDVYQLAPAQQLIYRDEKLNVSRYWDVRFDFKTKESEEEILERLDESIHQAVRKRLLSDVPLGAFLSGGVDSSLVVAMMAQEKSEPVEAIVIGFEDSAFDERVYARQVARYLEPRVKLHEHVLSPNAVMDLPEIIWQYGQPLADVSIIPTYYVAKAAKERVTVVLNGDGGDELFAGYARPLVASAAARYRKMLPRTLRHMLGQQFEGIEGGSLKRLSMLTTAGRGEAVESFVYNRAFRLYRDRAYSQSFSDSLDGYDPDILYREVWQCARATDDVDRALYGDFKTYLPDQLLAKMDTSTMAHSVEARSPLLDKSLIEYSATIPTNLRIKGYTTKYLLKKLAERYVPREVLYRRKRGFVMPVRDWLRGDLSIYLNAALKSDCFLERGWIEPEFAIRMLNEHTKEIRNWGDQLWTLFVLEIWARLMLDGSLSRNDSLEALL